MAEEAQQSEVWTFPTDPAAFDSDERISFSRLDNKYIAVVDDGTEYEFDRDLKRWVPIIDEELIQQQQAGYFSNSAEAESNEPSQHGKKRKSTDREDSNGRTKNSSKRQAREPPAPKQNTAIYVTGLPLDATAEEVHDLFSRKCGVIAEEIDSGRPRIKMYTDDKGQFKGDALVVFFKPQSVDMAVMLLDDSDFRLSSDGRLSAGRMRVMPADSSYKKTNNESGSNNAHVAGGGGAGKKNTVITGDEQQHASGGDGGEASNSASARPTDHAKHKQSHQDRQKIIRKTQKLAAKLADWDDDEPSSLPTGRPNIPEVKGASKRWDKVVILTHMFTLQELEEDPAALQDIEEDIREECEKLGDVTNVVLFDQEEEGIVSVKFSTPEAAEACVKLMHGRSFAGRTVEAYFATGKERFRKSKKSGGAEEEDAEG